MSKIFHIWPCFEHFDGFFCLRPLITFTNLCFMSTRSSSDTECFVKISSHISKRFWSYILFFSWIFRIKRLTRASNKERHKSFVFKGLACKILIKIDMMIHFEMRYTVIQGKLRFWISAWTQTYFLLYGASFCDKNCSYQVTPSKFDPSEDFIASGWFKFQVNCLSRTEVMKLQISRFCKLVASY